MQTTADDVEEETEGRLKASKRRYPRTPKQKEHYLECYLRVMDCKDNCFVRAHCIDSDKRLFRVNWWNREDLKSQFIYRSCFIQLERIAPEGPTIVDLTLELTKDIDDGHKMHCSI